MKCSLTFITYNLGPFHTRDWEPVTIIALQALSLVEKVEPVQICFPLHLRDQRSMWIQVGCKVQSHMTSHYIRASVTTTTWCWRCVGTAFGHFLFWALTISWPRLMARVWSGPGAMFKIEVFNALQTRFGPSTKCYLNEFLFMQVLTQW